MFNPILTSAIQQGLQSGSQELLQNPNALMKYVPGIAIFYASLKYYFHVNNSYVKRKLAVLLLPIKHKNWYRERTQGTADEPVKFEPPVNDINAPDLYIPAIAFVTYGLLVGFLKGTRMTFTPDVLGQAFNSLVFTVMFEVAAVKGGMYFFAPGISVPMLDLIAYSGYKCVGVSINMIIGIMFGYMFYQSTLLYTCACMGYFVYRTMESIIPEPPIDESGRKRRLYFLGMCCVLQCLTIWWLGYSGDFQSSTISPFSFGSGASPESTLVAGDVEVDDGGQDEM